MDSLAARRRAEKDIGVFLFRWRTAWMQSDSARVANLVYGHLRERWDYFHCHANEERELNRPISIQENYQAVTGKLGFSRCPTWELEEGRASGDEADSLDSAILPAFLPAIRSRRQELLSTLATLQRDAPNDPWLLGQRIRFSIDQGAVDEAMRLAVSCRINDWWCSALRGYVAYRQDSFAVAESSFLASISALPLTQRCGWTDLTPLLTANERRHYGTLSCAARDSLASTYWWLAKPLLTKPVNTRLVEHFARKVFVMLNSAMELGERFHWSTELGGDAVSETLIRYGWPTLAMWGGRMEDRQHDGYLKNFKIRPAPPYSTLEYTAGRIHYDATFAAALNPYQSTEDQWELNSESETDPGRTNDGKHWWPREHGKAAGESIVQLPVGQFATLRRQDSVAVVIAIDVDETVNRRVSRMSRRNVSALWVSSQGADAIQILARTRGVFGNRIAMQGMMQSRPTLLGLEIEDSRGDDRTTANASVLAARTRFGIRPPPPLNVLSGNEWAISDLILFAPSDPNRLPENLDAVMPSMIGSTTVVHGQPVGVFWENYGLYAGDSVQYSLKVSEWDPGLLRRIGSSIRVFTGPMSNIAVGWRDNQRSTGEKKRASDVPIVPAGIILDLSNLRRGQFLLEVELAGPGRPAVQAKRLFTIL